LAKTESVTPILPATGTREAILEAAKRLFDERGYDATSLRMIAETVGTTKAALYYHFPAKEHMLLELTRPMLDDLANLVAEFRDSDRASDPTAILEAYLDVFLEHLSVVGLLAREPATLNHPDIGGRLRLLVEAVQQHLAGPDATPETTTRATCAIGVIHAVSTLAPQLAPTQREIVLAAAVAALAPVG
jgi:AcrR family transcriptional regulator